MAKVKRKELILEGLDCANCASKIENKVCEIDGVDVANMNFVTKTLTINVGANKDIDTVVDDTNSVIKKLEPHIVVKEKVVSKPERKVIVLVGLGCANCAAKIEKEINALPEVKTAHVDFATRKLILEVYKKSTLSSIIDKAEKIASRIEPGLTFSEDAHDAHVRLMSTFAPTAQ